MNKDVKNVLVELENLINLMQGEKKREWKSNLEILKKNIKKNGK